MQLADAFSSSYAQARSKFLDAATRAGLSVQSFQHPLPGRDTEVLALDVALDVALEESGKELIGFSGVALDDWPRG